jgi:nucleoside-diphosphate-sugar epimerase
MTVMKALLTGPTGFIGSHLAEELLKRGYTVTCLVRKSSNLKWLENLDVTLHRGDCRDRDSLYDAIKGVDYIFHLAGLTRAPREKDFFEVNAKGTENLLEAVVSENPSIKRFIYVSSLAAAGPCPKGTPITEDTEPRPVSSYGRSKLEAERFVRKHSSSIPATIIRPPAVYGPRDRDFYLLYRMLNRGIFPYWGESYYSLVYVEDLVRGIISAAESKEAEGETFFLADTAIYSNIEIARVIADSLGRRPVRLPLPKCLVRAVAGVGKLFGANNCIINVDKARELGYSRWVCDPAKAQKKLGFSSQIPMDKGFRWTTNWYKIHQWL